MGIFYPEDFGEELDRQQTKVEHDRNSRSFDTKGQLNYIWIWPYARKLNVMLLRLFLLLLIPEVPGKSFGSGTDCCDRSLLIFCRPSKQILWQCSKAIQLTRCDNLIPGMVLCRQNLLIYALTTVIAFEILSLWSHALRERRWRCRRKQPWKSFPGMPCSNVTLRWMSRMSVNLLSIQGIFLILEIATNRKGLNQVNNLNGPCL
jgi:hypothetical protein